MRFRRKSEIWYALFLIGTFTVFLFLVFDSESIMLSGKTGSQAERYNDTFDEILSIALFPFPDTFRLLLNLVS